MTRPTSNREALERRRVKLQHQWTRLIAEQDVLVARLADTHAKAKNVELHIKALDHDLNQIVDTHWSSVEEAHRHAHQMQ